jgi:two-component system, OmpR family, alkaline phosphatase synthesis response regulator PhoP
MTEAKGRVLLVEDDRFLRKAAAARLREEGFDVLTAADGEEALRIARAETPDLVLLDLIMPKMQGFEVLTTLKADEATSGIPVVVLSNLGQERDIQEALAAGAVAYLVKANLSLESLVQKVGQLLGGAADR